MAYLKHAKYVKIKKCTNGVKFKLRLSRYLYTLAMNDPNKIKKIRQSLPPGLEKKDVGNFNYANAN
eukprot:CAMPEP_0114516416 /NCGR_PEP_ID=MMETSP0109-20121206/17313_1 /TAXON_ID=29199 /ORGANISM="Chlorarachnion reptans, Strain CCCM449" /LENGTH=65 /DNA_ID=CAMNT_0001696797 /DNA_START=333 /DNA_END=530 /DNA_ORIENTATION=-